MTWPRDRAQALALMHEWTASEPLRRHMLAVEVAMRDQARRLGGDEALWGAVGLLHDFDYERHPNPDRAPDAGHPAEGVRLLRALGLPPEACEAILGHAAYTGVPRTTQLARALYAVDELSGFLVACALVRPGRTLAGLEVAGVRKKLKDKGFARGVDRHDVIRGAEELGVPLDAHIHHVLEALRPHEPALGLGGP